VFTIIIPSDLWAWMGHHGHWVEDLREFATSRGWTGFGLVRDGDGEFLSTVEVQSSSHLCWSLLAASNLDVAERAICDQAGGLSCRRWNEFLAYDYDNTAARWAAADLTRSLARYPVLDDEEFFEREKATAARLLVDNYGVPVETGPAVIGRLLDRRLALCPACDPWDCLPEVMRKIGCRRCVLCGSWVSGTESCCGGES
jgi:hypothetical protein